MEGKKVMEYINLLLTLGIGLGLAIFVLGVFQNVVGSNATSNTAVGNVITQFSNFVSEYVGPIFSIVALVIIIWLVKKLGLI
jgi:type II secretory pathway component PulF